MDFFKVYYFLFQSSVHVTQIHAVINLHAYRCMGLVQGLQLITHVLVKERIKIAQTVRDIAQKMKFPLRISSVNVTKSAGDRGFGHIY